MKKHTALLTSILFLGLLTACASHRYVTEIGPPLTAAAKAELKQVDEGLRLYRAASEEKAFPSEDQIKSYEDLVALLAPYIELPEESEVHWELISYQRKSPGLYMIQAQVKNPGNTHLSLRAGGEIASSSVIPPFPR